MAVTPNMNMTLPTPSLTPGPTWADEVNAAFDVVDAHNHTSGSGVPVPTAGLDIDDDLSLNENALLDADHLGMSQQSSTLGPSIVDSLYDVNGDLYFNNGAGTPVQVTTGNAVNVSETALVPAGIMYPYGGTSAPTGFLICNGAAVSRTTYSALFLVIGTNFGAGDSSTTFNIPSMNGRTPIGAGTYTDPVLGDITRTLGTFAGAASTVLTEANLASHQHGLGGHVHTTLGNANASGSTPPNGTNYIAKARSDGDAQDYLLLGTNAVASIGLTSAAAGMTDPDGSGTSHNTMQPYLVTNFIIKY